MTDPTLQNASLFHAATGPRSRERLHERLRFASARQRWWILTIATALCWWAAGAWEIFPLGWFALVPFFLLVNEENPKKRFVSGYRAGVVAFWIIHWWLIPTITRGSVVIGAPEALGFVLSIVAVTLIAVLSALAPAVTALAAGSRAWWMPFGAASVWVLGDVVRISTPLAHSWGALAYSQTRDPLLLASAFWLGQHGLTWICVFVAACAALWWRTRQRHFVWMPALVLLFAHALGATRWTFLAPKSNDSVRVLVVQTNVPSLSKRGFEPSEPPVSQALRLTRAAVGAANSQTNSLANLPDLVMWPETTMQLTASRSGFYSGLDAATWWELGLDVPLLTGARVQTMRGESFNSVLLLNSQASNSVQSYSKTNLVPFGERPPFVEIFPWLSAFAPRPMLERGEGANLLTLQGGALVRPAICFESCFPLQTQVNGKIADFLFVATNDEWFAGTEASRQHRAMGRLRAAENGIALVQSCNGAYAFVADARGALLATTTSDEPQTLTVEVPISRSSSLRAASQETARP